MVATVTEDQVLFRPRRVVWMCTPLAVVLLAVFVTVAMLLRDSDTGVIFQASDQVAMIGIGILLAGATMLFTRPRVRADTEGIEVRNVFTTRRFSWAEVLSVSFPDGASFARLELPDDEYYSVVAVQAVDRERAVLAVRTLRRLHKQARGE
ncbi:PH domain-containing protein [Amycolatopsis cihanbeyliensis]|uniref:PH (Pleckstrin Homology) domain-containing protein n=1 Tax=Amycolatopsis cihanbeyliensis TaxID=1128664 RepID=A0A542CSY8_AMYCI|nr:PH domain-containing protein [Amycolatopsis cihanbeyliensis]TQI93904.1 PH (Pleckstrin Homology) domain-containing protein [Amycolatopsis cihanbeyliensis]